MDARITLLRGEDIGRKNRDWRKGCENLLFSIFDLLLNFYGNELVEQKE